MLTVVQYAEKIGRSYKTVQNWCARGLIPGAFKTRIGRNTMYLLPESAPSPQLSVGRPKESCKPNPPEEPEGKTFTREELCDFIRKNCSKMTYGQLSRVLGIPAAEVRRIYDQLHETYGI